MASIPTRHTVKGKKLPTMKTPHLSGLKNSVTMKAGGLKFGKKTRKHVNPLGMKAAA